MFDMPFDEFANVVTMLGVSVAKSAGLDFTLGMINIAPVDTSRYVSNMNVSFDVPDYSHDNMKFIGTAGARAQTIAKFGVMRPNVLQDVYITNTISYASDIEARTFAPNGVGVFNATFLATAFYYAGK